MIDQDAAHDLGRDAEKVRPILTSGHSLIDQAQISFMHQPGRLQGVVVPLVWR